MWHNMCVLLCKWAEEWAVRTRHKYRSLFAFLRRFGICGDYERVSLSGISYLCLYLSRTADRNCSCHTAQGRQRFLNAEVHISSW